MATAYPETAGAPLVEKIASDVGRVTEEKHFFQLRKRNKKNCRIEVGQFYLLLIALLMQKPACWLELKPYPVKQKKKSFPKALK